LFESDRAGLIQLPDLLPSLHNVSNLKEIITDLQDTFYDSLESDLSRDFELINEQIQQMKPG
jgi:hypothetical protein